MGHWEGRSSYITDRGVNDRAGGGDEIDDDDDGDGDDDDGGGGGNGGLSSRVSVLLFK